MIGDSFDYNGKQYIIKRDVTFGENRIMNKLQLDIQNAKPEDELKLANKFNQLMADFFESNLGLTQEDMNSLSLLDSAELFGKAFLISTSIKKKLETTSESQSLQTTHQIQP